MSVNWCKGYLLRTTGLSLGLTFSAISSQREKGEMETSAADEGRLGVAEDGDPPGCRGRSNMHRWYLKPKAILFHFAYLYGLNGKLE